MKYRDLQLYIYVHMKYRDLQFSIKNKRRYELLIKNMKPGELEMCGSRKYPYPPPHGGSRKFQGVEGCERGKSPKGKGVYKELFFPEGWKCDRIKHLRHTFILIQGNQNTLKILSVEIT